MDGFGPGRPFFATFLLNCGCDISLCSVEYGNVVSEIVSFGFNESTISIRRLKCVLARLGTERSKTLINFRSEWIQTSLYEAARHNLGDFAHLSLQDGAEINAVGGPDEAALMVAARTAA